MQGILLGSFYYGYCITQIPGGRLAEMYSGKLVFGCGVLITAILNLLTPLAARWSLELLIAIRVMEGLAQGVTMPAMHSMIGRWLPETEKGFLTTLIYIGITVGTVISMLATGYLCQPNIFGGWPAAFYVFGIIGCFWCVLWAILVTDSPSTHPWITKQELKYIERNQNIQKKLHSSELSSIPWKSILTSAPFIALVITQFGQDWCFFTILNDLPTFTSTILHFKVEMTGMVSALPNLFGMAVSCAVGFLNDIFIRRKWCTTNFARKFCNSVSCIGSAAGLMGVILAGCNVKLTIAMFSFSVAIGGFCYCGYMLSHLDLSPEYAGTLMGIANTISNLSGFMAPAVVGLLTDKHQTLKQWHTVFYITNGIMLTTGIVYVIFVTSEKQNWTPSEHKQLLLKNDQT